MPGYQTRAEPHLLRAGYVDNYHRSLTLRNSSSLHYRISRGLASCLYYLAVSRFQASMWGKQNRLSYPVRMSLFKSGTRGRLTLQAITHNAALRTRSQFSTSASVLQIRPDSTFFSSNNTRLGSCSSGVFSLTKQQPGKGVQRWEGTLRDGSGNRRSFSVSYGSLGEQDMVISFGSSISS